MSCNFEDNILTNNMHSVRCLCTLGTVGFAPRNNGMGENCPYSVTCPFKGSTRMHVYCTMHVCTYVVYAFVRHGNSNINDIRLLIDRLSFVKKCYIIGYFGTDVLVGLQF